MEQTHPPQTTQGGGLPSASLLGSRFPLPQDGGTGACTPAKLALLKSRSPAAAGLAEQAQSRGKSSCRGQHSTRPCAGREERGENTQLAPGPSALKCIFSLTCNTVLLSQTMSVFDQFLYPRHCRAERPRRPDGSCCRSLPALPHPPPNSLQIPGMPAPLKTSPGQGRGKRRPPEEGLGTLPSLPSSPPAAHTGQVPGGKRLLSPPQGHQRAARTRSQRSTGPPLPPPTAGGFLC